MNIKIEERKTDSDVICFFCGEIIEAYSTYYRITSGSQKTSIYAHINCLKSSSRTILNPSHRNFNIEELKESFLQRLNEILRGSS